MHLTGRRLAYMPTVKSGETAALKCKCGNIILCPKAGKLIFYTTETGASRGQPQHIETVQIVLRTNV